MGVSGRDDHRRMLAPWPLGGQMRRSSEPGHARPVRLRVRVDPTAVCVPYPIPGAPRPSAIRPPDELGSLPDGAQRCHPPPTSHRPRTGQPDRRPHRLQPRPRTAHGHRPRRDRRVHPVGGPDRGGDLDGFERPPRVPSATSASTPTSARARTGWARLIAAMVALVRPGTGGTLRLDSHPAARGRPLLERGALRGAGRGVRGRGVAPASPGSARRPSTGSASRSAPWIHWCAPAVAGPCAAHRLRHLATEPGPVPPTPRSWWSTRAGPAPCRTSDYAAGWPSAKRPRRSSGRSARPARPLVACGIRVLRRRARHVVTECPRVRAGPGPRRRRPGRRPGPLMTESHRAWPTTSRSRRRSSTGWSRLRPTRGLRRPHDRRRVRRLRRGPRRPGPRPRHRLPTRHGGSRPGRYGPSRRRVSGRPAMRGSPDRGRRRWAREPAMITRCTMTGLRTSSIQRTSSSSQSLQLDPTGADDAAEQRLDHVHRRDHGQPGLQLPTGHHAPSLDDPLRGQDQAGGAPADHPGGQPGARDGDHQALHPVKGHRRVGDPDVEGHADGRPPGPRPPRARSGTSSGA